MGKVSTLLVGEALIGLPAVLMILWHKEQWREWLPLHKIKLSTILLLVVFSYLIMPIAILANAVSMLFVENEVVTAMSVMADIPSVLLVAVVGIYGPICEEVAFRGVIFGRYRRTGRVLASAILSAVLFGLMHLNGNQLGYTILLGFAFAMLIEATGSIWAPLIVHMVVNTHNTLMLLMSGDFLELTGSTEALSALSYTRAELSLTIAFLLPLAAFMTLLAIGCYLLIARNEGRLPYLRQIFTKSETGQKRPHFATWSLVVAVLICIFIIFILPFIG